MSGGGARRTLTHQESSFHKPIHEMFSGGDACAAASTKAAWYLAIRSFDKESAATTSLGHPPFERGPTYAARWQAPWPTFDTHRVV